MKALQDEWGNLETFKIDDEKAHYYRDVGITMVKTGMRLYGDGSFSGKWILSAEDHHHGDRAFYIKTENMGRVIAVEATVNADLATVFHEAWIHIEKVTEYNPTVRDYKILEDVSDHTRIVYNASHEIFGGLLSSRDFVDVNAWRKIDGAYYHAGRSVDYADMPHQKGKIRGENLIGWMRLAEPAGQKGKTNVCVMASADFKGMLPKSLTDRGMTHYLVEYVRHFKKHLESLNGH